MTMPTEYGVFLLYVWKGERGRETVALTTPNLDPSKEVLLRIHSECLTGDVFASHSCDCGPQKELALKRIKESGNGIFIYHRQEGRNMGLFKKIEAYNLMEQGFDTHEASLALVNHPDPREYSEVSRVLDTLLSNCKPRIRLLTNNPYKVLFLERYGYQVAAEPLRVEATAHNIGYTSTKTEKFLHNSIGYGPYVSPTLFLEDIEHVGSALSATLKKFDAEDRNRRIFLGIAVSSEQTNQATARALNIFYESIRNLHTVTLVIHTAYPEKRKNEKDFGRFLGQLSFPYSLQFRSQNPHVYIDIAYIDSLNAQHLIFQLKEGQFDLLEESAFVQYFKSPNKFLLLDESWGTGKKEGVDQKKTRILKLVSHGISRVAVAGGYDAANVSEVTELEDYFKIPISVDAESGLRTEGKFDIEKMSAYLSYFFPQTM